MVVGQIGETGAHVIVITALEQELGTEHDRATTHHHIAMECKQFARYLTSNTVLKLIFKNAEENSAKVTLHSA